MNKENILQALNIYGSFSYRDQSDNPKVNAVYNLRGKNYFAENLNGGERITFCESLRDGLGLAVILVMDGLYNIVVFDVFGDRIYDAHLKTRKHAKSCMHSFLSTWDILSYTKNRIKEKILFERATHEKALSALSGEE
jgi:hypothetical protein